MTKTGYALLASLFVGSVPGAAQPLVNAVTPLVTVGLQVGTDIGGAIPFPLKYLPAIYNPYPHLNLSLGGTVGTAIVRSWSLYAGVVYKTISINADARVKNQKFQDKESVQYFTGSAYMQQRFTLLEMPLYAMYHFDNGHDRVLGGLYYARTLEGIFHIEPRKGFIASRPDTFEAEIPADMEVMRFDSSLDTWNAGLLVGYERQLFTRVCIGLRVSCGFKDIFKRHNAYFDYSMLHARGSVVLSYDLAHFPLKACRVR
ncbi:MAG: PorT family protein [Odoribacteraceae bacterium]|jgi:hypothetical protein|nr:PorT family protein [Odoribacteraceae bacterium]